MSDYSDKIKLDYTSNLADELALLEKYIKTLDKIRGKKTPAALQRDIDKAATTKRIEEIKGTFKAIEQLEARNAEAAKKIEDNLLANKIKDLEKYQKIKDKIREETVKEEKKQKDAEFKELQRAVNRTIDAETRRINKINRLADTQKARQSTLDKKTKLEEARLQEQIANNEFQAGLRRLERNQRLKDKFREEEARAERKKTASTFNFIDTFKKSLLGSVVFSGVQKVLDSAYLILNQIPQALAIYGKFDQSIRSLGVLAGSKGRGKELFNQGIGVAIDTPFDTLQVEETIKKLAAFGIAEKELIATTRILADVTSAVGLERLPNLSLALGQVAAKTQLYAAEIRQFTENGVPLLQLLSDATGRTVKQLTEDVPKGLIKYSDVISALQKATSKGGYLFGLSESQSKSYLGTWNRLLDAMEIRLAQFGESLSKYVKPVINYMYDIIGVKPNDLLKDDYIEKDTQARTELTKAKILLNRGFNNPNYKETLNYKLDREQLDNATNELYNQFKNYFQVERKDFKLETLEDIDKWQRKLLQNLADEYYLNLKIRNEKKAIKEYSEIIASITSIQAEQKLRGGKDVNREDRPLFPEKISNLEKDISKFKLTDVSNTIAGVKGSTNKELERLLKAFEGIKVSAWLRIDNKESPTVNPYDTSSKLGGDQKPQDPLGRLPAIRENIQKLEDTRNSKFPGTDQSRLTSSQSIEYEVLRKKIEDLQKDVEAIERGFDKDAFDKAVSDLTIKLGDSSTKNVTFKNLDSTVNDLKEIKFAISDLDKTYTEFVDHSTGERDPSIDKTLGGLKDQVLGLSTGLFTDVAIKSYAEEFAAPIRDVLAKNIGLENVVYSIEQLDQLQERLLGYRRDYEVYVSYLKDTFGISPSKEQTDALFNEETGLFPKVTKAIKTAKGQVPLQGLQSATAKEVRLFEESGSSGTLDGEISRYTEHYRALFNLKANFEKESNANIDKAYVQDKKDLELQKDTLLYEEYYLKMKELDAQHTQDKLDNAEIYAKQYKLLQEGMAKAETGLKLNIAAKTLGIISEVADAYSTQSRTAFETAKVLGIGVSLINTYTAITKALGDNEVPPWLRWANAIAAGVTGFLQVRSIEQLRYGESLGGSSANVRPPALNQVKNKDIKEFDTGRAAALQAFAFDSNNNKDIIKAIDNLNQTVVKQTETQILEQRKKN